MSLLNKRHVPTRRIRLDETLAQVLEVIGDEGARVFLFGSRVFGPGSLRSDIDLLIETSIPLTQQMASDIWAIEPYFDIFEATGRTASSIVNGSRLNADAGKSLVDTVSAFLLFDGGTWNVAANKFVHQDMLMHRNPAATMVPLYDLSSAEPFRNADILVVTALEEEFKAAQRILGTAKNGDVHQSSITDELGNVWALDLILINTMGSVSAALRTFEGLLKTKASHAVLLGIAAGLPKKVKLGDVVIVDEVFTYESAKLATKWGRLERLENPHTGRTHSDVRRNAAALDFSSVFDRDKPSYSVHTDGVMASGEKVVANRRFRDRLVPRDRKLSSIDMESFGVATAAHARGVPFSVIKGICDYADGHKNDTFHVQAAESSAKVLRYLVENGAFRATQ